MKQTVSILVENHAGVLSRISGLFARRGFNIESLAVGTTEDPAISRVTIVVDGDAYTLEQVEKQLNKLIDVITLRKLPPDHTVSRELMLIKVKADPDTGSEIAQIAEDAGAWVCDVSPSSVTVEIANTTEKVEAFLTRLRPYGFLEVVRTGSIALEKGGGSLTAGKETVPEDPAGI